MNDRTKLKAAALAAIRRNAWMAIALIAVLLVISGAYQRLTAPPKVDIGGAFTLTDQNGSKVNDSTYRGKVEIIYFGYTNCPDVCPTTLTLIGNAMKTLKPNQAKQIQPIFITLDPARDTPSVIGAYVKYFVPGMAGLTGTPQEIAKAAQEFRIAYQKVKGPNPDQPYSIDHASIIYVMDRKGRFYRDYLHGVTADQLAAGLRQAI
jgi:protein SCO1